MISTTRKISILDIDPGDELDLADDEYGDNELAVSEYAVILDIHEVEDADGFTAIQVITSQGPFVFPLDHKVKIKIG